MSEEYDKMAAELEKTREKKSGHEFYKAMTDFTYEGKGRHESPTRRLREQKNTVLEHKKALHTVPTT